MITRTAAPLALAGALVLALTACSGSKTDDTATAPAVTVTKTVTAAPTGLPAACQNALDQADELGESYAKYIGLTGDMFGAIGRNDSTYVVENSDPIKAHMAKAVELSKAYAAARETCKEASATRTSTS